MTSKSIVVVDRGRVSGFALRNCLARAGDTAHIFSNFKSALKMIERKKIDSVVVEFDTDKETTAFCDAARALGVSVVFASSPIQPFDIRQYGFIASFPRLPVQYCRH
jgi:DNA-binding NtrC family response regulator